MDTLFSVRRSRSARREVLRWLAVALVAVVSPGCFVLPPLVALSDLDSDTPIGTPALVHGAVGVGAARFDDDWAPADQPLWLSLDADHRLGKIPLWYATYFGYGITDEVPAASPDQSGSDDLFDFGLGVRHYQAYGRFEPFVGLGGAYMDSGRPGGSYSYGGYFEAGVVFTCVGAFGLGATWRRFLGPSQELEGVEFDADYSTLMLQLTFRH